MSLEPTPVTKEVYEYLLSVSSREPDICRELRLAAKADKYYKMQIGPETGQFLAFLSKLMGARRCIEIGTYMGYSALWLALHLPDDGELIACDINLEYGKTAQKYWKKAKVDHKIHLYTAPALETLHLLQKNHTIPLDLAFIDADKENYSAYYEACLQLIRPGGLLLFDNTLWGGLAAGPEDQSPSTKAIRTFNTKLFEDQRVDMTLIPIGDGLSLARKK